MNYSSLKEVNEMIKIIIEENNKKRREQRQRGRKRKEREKMNWIDTDKRDAGILMILYYDAVVVVVALFPSD